MSVTLLILRLLLAGVFAAAGVAKLFDLSGSREAMKQFGVPSRLAPTLGTLLPIAELTAAVALLPDASARWGALEALVLLMSFVAAIGLNLARGRTPDCHCFGQLHSSPAGWSTLVRNALLAAAAGVVVWRGGTAAAAWRSLDRLSPSAVVALAGGLALAVVTAAGAWFMLSLLRQQGRMLLRIDDLEDALRGAGLPLPGAARQDGLTVGTAAPDFSLAGLHAEVVTLESLVSRERPLLLVFTDPGCGPCTALMPEVATWQRDLASQLTVAIVSRGSVADNRAKSKEHGVHNVILQNDDREVDEAYLVEATPSAVLVDQDGRVASAVAAGPDQIRALVAQVHQPPPSVVRVPGRSTGDAAPQFELQDLDGTQVSDAQLEGRTTLLLFWNPGCGFCQQMLPDITAWESARGSGEPELLVVSIGSAADNRAQGFRAPVLLDPGFSVMRAFGADGTPSGLLIDAERRIASGLAVGAPAVLELARGAASRAT